MLKTRKLIKITSLLIFFTFCLYTFSQTKEEALRDAKKTTIATLNSDIKTIIKYTYPLIIKIMGGKEKAILAMSKMIKEISDNGFKFEKAEVISISEIIEEQNEYRCLVKNNYVMIFNDEKIISECYLFGIYNDQKSVWNFIEAKQLQNRALKLILPDFKTAIKIPEKKITTIKN